MHNKIILLSIALSSSICANSFASAKKAQPKMLAHVSLDINSNEQDSSSFIRMGEIRLFIHKGIKHYYRRAAYSFGSHSPCYQDLAPIKPEDIKESFRKRLDVAHSLAVAQAQKTYVYENSKTEWRFYADGSLTRVWCESPKNSKKK